MSRLLLLNKPFGVLCQFSGGDGRQTLADFIKQPGYYAAGRLDRDSEGLLILTNDGRLQQRISHPRHKLRKRYRVQVEGHINDEALARLQSGVPLKDGMTRPARSRATDEPDWLWPRNPPVRFRARIPTSWLELELQEGRNRQVRRMTAAVGFPTLRLIRVAIGGCQLDTLAPGETRWEDASALLNARPQDERSTE